MTAYETETRTIDGRTFRVEWEYDDYMGPPQTEADGHGIVETFRDDPTDFDPEGVSLEEAVRFQMMRRMGHGGRRGRSDVPYYDVWETLKKAKGEGWGVPNPVGLTPDERAMEAVEVDYEYIAGWYNDEWYWCGITVTEVFTDEEGEETDGMEESLGGICSNDYPHHEEVIKELVAQMPVEAMS
jgi:hypothetical protein